MIGKVLKKGNTAVYIDASNTFFAEKKLDFKVDFVKLHKYLQRESNLKYVKYYSPYKPSDRHQKSFFDMLQKQGYELILKEIKTITTNQNKIIIKGNIDIELALDVMEDVKKYQNIILFSGDSDFYTLLQRLASKGKNVLIVSTKSIVSTELRSIGHFIDIKLLKQYIKLDDTEFKNNMYYNKNEEILFFINL